MDNLYNQLVELPNDCYHPSNVIVFFIRASFELVISDI